MKVKRIVSEERMLLPELRDTLLSVEAARLESEEEMSYELRKSIEHANHLSKASSERARALVDELIKLEKMKEEIAYRIANLMPRTRDELRAIYAKERFNLTTEELDEILDLVMTHF
ncbi:RNA polymerase Rpb4 family protein [Methanoculleus sp. YWC-01]|jgi:DNA-directed RNA polymerase subunit F|uniref:DNA-directed RNA polymerase subunit Rpo4 n=1 Tax=Methanoculleus nereidis TaxID=2735141 RepID=A0ABU3Z196_9EURY|nr:RNA polymerase Rpb4 family protein [Methanoculleus sp. YWC-01]MCK9297843.1 RNA polymerase Rpb4 family protein [Methanoculleus sp.]MDV4342587.1 RNA polymerase Rpb4 family protein [Methanoculleus sp. YWC-01]PKL55153.1 MAG: DNA-directed RNA polymerase subunit F [Methanomicrobiales archaeon HGW-Methanomicrobiales-6]